jgi:hypothetical protein
MIIYPETRTPGSRFVNLRIDGFIDIKDLTASFTSEMIMIIVSGIEPAIVAAQLQLQYLTAPTQLSQIPVNGT